MADLDPKKQSSYLFSGMGKGLYNLIFFQIELYLSLFIALAMFVTGEKEKNKRTRRIGEILMVSSFFVIAFIAVLISYYAGHWRQLEKDFSFTEAVEYQQGEHQIFFVRGTSLNQYRVNLLIDGSGMYFNPINDFLRSPIFIPWNKVQKCIKADRGNNVTQIRFPIKNTDFIFTLNHWDIIHPLCKAKGLEIDF